jgi:hypothetical protein
MTQTDGMFAIGNENLAKTVIVIILTATGGRLVNACLKSMRYEANSRKSGGGENLKEWLAWR